MLANSVKWCSNNNRMREYCRWGSLMLALAKNEGFSLILPLCRAGQVSPSCPQEV